MSEDLTGVYCACMEDVKRRLTVVKQFTSGQCSIGSEDLNYECVAVQLRKSLELIAFASVAANKKAYAEAHADFARDWNAKRMLDRLERLHPGFYPEPVQIGSAPEAGAKSFVSVQDGFLTRDEFVTLYDLCCAVLHTLSPFSERDRSVDFGRSVAEWVERIERLLRQHYVRLMDSDDLWFADMDYPTDGRVHAFTATPSSPAI